MGVSQGIHRTDLARGCLSLVLIGALVAGMCVVAVGYRPPTPPLWAALAAVAGGLIAVPPLVVWTLS